MQPEQTPAAGEVAIRSPRLTWTPIPAPCSRRCWCTLRWARPVPMRWSSNALIGEGFTGPVHRERFAPSAACSAMTPPVPGTRAYKQPIMPMASWKCGHSSPLHRSTPGVGALGAAAAAPRFPRSGLPICDSRTRNPGLTGTTQLRVRRLDRVSRTPRPVMLCRAGALTATLCTSRTPSFV